MLERANNAGQPAPTSGPAGPPPHRPNRNGGLQSALGGAVLRLTDTTEEEMDADVEAAVAQTAADDFSSLPRNWLKLKSLSGTPNASVSTESDDYQIVFKSDTVSYYLRQEGGWWITDGQDDRGRRYYSTARLSTFELSEKYLIWEWAGSLSSADARLLHLGTAPDVQVEPTDRDYFVELRAPTGSAILPLSSATTFSYLISKSVDEVVPGRRRTQAGDPRRTRRRRLR
ncbi:MAG: hypothetical protein ACPGVG_16655 [Mycobacterium sp.]